MTKRMRIVLGVASPAVLVAWLAGAACSMSTGARGDAPGASPTGASSGAGGATAAAGSNASAPAGGTAGAGVIDTLPPEREIDNSYEAPVATGHFVWIANPTSGRVAYVDATSLTVSTIEAGNGPRYLAAVPSPKGDTDAVVVLNTLSNDATYLAAPAGGGALTSRTIEGVAPGSNAWAMSPDGRFALAWTDSSLLPVSWRPPKIRISDDSRSPPPFRTRRNRNVELVSLSATGIFVSSVAVRVASGVSSVHVFPSLEP